MLFRSIIYGVALILVVRFAPEGITGWLAARAARRAVVDAS